MIYIIRKILALLKNHLNYLKYNILELFCKKYIRLLFKKFFSQKIMMKNPKPQEEKTIEDIRNHFRLKNKLSYTAIKDIRNLFRL